MAEHEGWYVQAKVDISGLLQANKETAALVANLKKVDSGLSGIKPNESLAKNIKSADIATASYIERLKSAGKTYEADKQQARLYEEQIEKLTNRQKGLTRELENIASKSGKTSDAYQIQKARINQTATAINNFKKDLQDTQRDMDRVKPTAFNRLTSSANKAVQAGDKMKSTLHEGWDRVKGGAIAAGAGVAVFTGAAVKGAKEAGTLQQRYREINNLAVLGGEKQREVTRSIARMQEQGRNISIRYGKSQQEIAEGYEDLVKRGYSTKQALGALKTEVQASVASGDHFSDVTTVSSQVLDAFGMRAKSTAKMLKNTKSVVNELAYSADATSTGFSDIGVAMSYVGSTAKANKVSLAETASALGVLSNNGLEADKAGTALRGTINGLTNQINNIGKKNSIFDKLGIKKSEMVDAHGNLKSLSHDMAVLYQHIQAHSSGSSQQNGFFKSIFGTTGMNGAMILAKDSKEVQNLTDRTAKAGRTGSYVAQLAAKNMGTAQGATASAKQAMNAFTITIGKAVLPALNEASNALAKFLLSKDGEQFQHNVGHVVGDFAETLINLIKFASTHRTTMKLIGGGFLVGYGTVKTAEALSFVGKLYQQYKDLAEINPKIKDLGTTTKQLVSGSTGFKNMTKGAKLAVGVSAVFSAAQIGNDFYQAATARNATQRIKSAGAGVGGILGGAIGAVVGGPVGAQIGVELGQAMGPSAAKSFGKAFSGHAAKYFVYGGSGSKSSGRYSRQAERYTHDGYYRVSNSRIKGRTPLYEYDDNGYYNTRTHKYTDQRSLAERAWGMSHRLNTQSIAHPHNLWDLIAGSGDLLWNTAGHLGDKDFWHRSRQGIIASEKGSWLDWSGFFNWVRKPKAGESRNYNPLAGPAKGVASWWNNTAKNTKIDWGPFDLSKWMNGFKPSVHGKAPKHAELKTQGILPPINGKKWASGIVKDAQKGFKGFPKFTRDLGGKSSKWFKSKWKGMEAWGKKTKGSAQSGFHGFEGWTSKLSGKANRWFKGKWHGMSIWGSRTRKNAQNGFHGFEKWSGQLSGNANRWFKSKWKGMKSWSAGIHKDVQAGWNGFKKWLGGIGTAAVNLFKKPFEGLGKWVSDHIPKPVKAVMGGIGKGISWAKGKLTGKAHANGGAIRNNHAALVGEAGPELAYKPYANNVRLLGANGPEFTNVHAGEHILNARDTAKVMSGGLGNGVTLKGYANGTTGLSNTSKNVSKDYKSMAQSSSKSLNKLVKTNRSSWSKIKKNAGSSTGSMVRKNHSDWSKVASQTSKLTAKARKEATSNYSDMRSSVSKQMDNMHTSVVKTANSTAKGFGKAMDKTVDYAKSAMSGTMGEMNKGIRGIDKVLSQFGGNGQVIKPVHFATGTDASGRLTRNTFAMVNDATTGPRQEALVSPDNRLYLPRGENLKLVIPRGWGVLNGTQTQQVAKKAGVQHFAKGSGVSHSELRKLAERANADPSRWFKSAYSENLKFRGSDLAKGTTSLGDRSSTKYGNPWSTALWGVINKQIDSDGGSINAKGLLKAVEKYGEGHKYVWGATGPSTFDCSGLVMYALKHAYGINYPHFSGSQYSMTSHISRNEARMGDLVFWGPGGSDHVGVYAGGNKYFSAESPAQGIHMNTLNSVVGKGKPLFGRVKGMPSPKSAAKHPVKADSRLTALVKRELGASALKWIKNNLGDEGGGFGNPAGDGVNRWRKYITRAASQMHTSVSNSEISKILSMISAESSGNPTITQQIQDVNSAAGDPAQGLLQFIPPTFNTFAAKGHHKIKNGYDQLLALFNDSNWRSDIHYGGGWGPTGHRRFAKGGRHITGPFIAGERGPELITPDGPVRVDTHEQTKRKVRDLADSFKPRKVTTSTRAGRQPITININFNGNIGGSDSDMRRMANVARREVARAFEDLLDHGEGSDESIY